MNQSEREALIRTINEENLESGRVVKAGGIWHISSKKSCVVAPPKINLPYWQEGTKAVVIEHRK